MSQEQLKDMYRQVNQAMVDKDIPKLNKLLKPETVLVHMTGYHQPVSEWLDQIESEEEIINKFKAYKIMLDSVIIGAFFLIPVNENQARFEDFVIKPEYQGNGYGTKTLQILEEMHPDITAWYLSTPVFSIGNQHLYEKCGYKEIDRNKEEIEYCKQLK